MSRSDSSSPFEYPSRTEYLLIYAEIHEVQAKGDEGPDQNGAGDNVIISARFRIYSGWDDQ